EDFQDHHAVSREVFFNVPGPLEAVFYGVLPMLFLAAAWLFSRRVRNWERGQPDNRRTTTKNVKRRVADFRAGVYMQTLLRDPAAGLMHSMIYFGFLSLAIVTAVLEIDHQLPPSWKFLHGRTYQGYSAFADAAGVIFVVGILWAVWRRYVQRVYRVRIKTRPEDALILGTFLVIGISGFVTEALRISTEHHPAYERWSFIGYPLAWAFRAPHPTAHQALWVTHVVAFGLFVLILPTT